MLCSHRGPNHCDFIVIESSKFRIKFQESNKKIFTSQARHLNSEILNPRKTPDCRSLNCKMISQDENFVGGRGGKVEGMKRISVRIIQSSSDYPANMELCQVEAGCNCGTPGLLTTAWRRARLKMCLVCEWVLPPLRAVAFDALIEIISMRIEPSQTCLRAAWLLLCSSSASPSAFTLLSFWMTEDPCNIKVQIVEVTAGPWKGTSMLGCQTDILAIAQSFTSIVMCFVLKTKCQRDKTLVALLKMW